MMAEILWIITGRDRNLLFESESIYWRVAGLFERRMYPETKIWKSDYISFESNIVTANGKQMFSIENFTGSGFLNRVGAFAYI